MGGDVAQQGATGGRSRRMRRGAYGPAMRSSMPRIALVLLAVLAPGLAAAQAPRQPGQPWRCGEQTYCTQMTSCAEAMFHFRSCGLTRLDRDRDGMPCETLCGQGGRGGSTRRR
jgi:hypothetical protein